MPFLDTLLSLPRKKSWLIYLHDLLMVALSFGGALYLRLGDQTFDHINLLLTGTGLYILIALPLFRVFGLYRGMWRYASVQDLSAIVKVSLLLLLIGVPALFIVNRLDMIPRTVPVIQWFLLIVLLGGPRLLYRVLKEKAVTPQQEKKIPVLLVGTNELAETFLRSVGTSGYSVVGLIEPNSEQLGRKIHGVTVLGTLDTLPSIIAMLDEQDRRPQKLILADNYLKKSTVRSLLEQADTLNIPLARLPRLTDFTTADPSHLQIRPIALEDLLGRPQTTLNRHEISTLITGRTVLITGAGGSIGSELVRQIAALAPARLILLENSEFNLYSIDMELAGRHPEILRSPILADVRDRFHVNDIMRNERPDLVFHAAALKHVPMVEFNPIEGLMTNVIGTKNIADACLAAGVSAMVMISTDKAVNPTNVMGASKRIAESYCQALDMESTDCRFITVRFGNVLGSTGSVIPLFQKQLAAGGPLTVTHPDVTRYFMTIREASLLVLQAAAYGSQEENAEIGKIFVLDMGEPIRIHDLACQMIRLAGLRPETDIRIAYTGLRPGEKLFEEIFHGAEPPLPTKRDGLLLATPRLQEIAKLRQKITTLEKACRELQQHEALAAMQDLVPEYQAANT